MTSPKTSFRLFVPRNEYPLPVKRLLFNNNAFQVLFGLYWWLPIFYTYQKQAGLSDSQIFFIQGAYYAAFCLLEFPTGFIADRIGPRRCMRLGALMMTAANLVPVGWPTFGGFATHFLLIAGARSLVSGAGSAYLYDSLHGCGYGHHYVQAEGNARALGLAAKVICWPIGSLLGSLVHSSPYWLSAASSAGAFAFSLRLASIRHVAHRDDRGSNTGALRGIIRAFSESPALGPLMLLGVSLFTLVRVCQSDLFQPILLDHGIPVSQHGSIMSVMAISEATASAHPRIPLRYMSPPLAVAMLSALMAFGLASLNLPGSIAAVGLLCLFAATGGMAYPLQRGQINDAIPDLAPRSTLLSIESILDRAICALASMAAGYFLSRGLLHTYVTYLAFGAVTVLGIATLSLGTVRKKSDVPSH